MTITATTKSKSQTSDFKRIKAKVGKRAPKKLNVTETSFRSTKVNVRPQQLPTTTTTTTTNTTTTINTGGDSFSRDHHHNNNYQQQEDEIILTQLVQSLSNTLVKLNHPAAPVRVSVLETVRTLIVSNPIWINSSKSRTGNVTLMKFPLAMVLPPLFKCLVDDQTQVRTLAMTLLINVFRLLLQSHSTTTTTATATIVYSFAPFLSLWLAYISSAFHSLDPDIRYHGCISLHFVCANLHTLLLEKWDTYFPNVTSILSAFVTVFTDLSTSSMGRMMSNNNNKQKQDDKKRNGRGNQLLMRDKTKMKIRTKQDNDTMTVEVLKETETDTIQYIPFTTSTSKGIVQSFICFLNLVESKQKQEPQHQQCQKDSNDNNNTTDSTRMIQRILHVPAMNKAPFSFTVGSHTTNALLCNYSLTYTSHRHSVSTIHSWDQVTNLLGKHNQISSTSTTHTPSNTEPSTLMSTVTLILEQLRNRFVEVIQHEDSMDIRIHSKTTYGRCGVQVPEYEIDSLSLLLDCIRQVWFCWCHRTVGTCPSESSSSTVKTIQGIFSLLLESFPIKPKHHTSQSSQQQQHQQQYSMVNAIMACLIFDLGQSIHSTKDEWIGTLFSYCILYLQSFQSGYDESMNTEASISDYQQPTENQLNHSSINMDSILDIVEKLLLSGRNSTPTNHPNECLDSWTVLFTEFCNVFFPQGRVPSNTRMKSKSGRKAVGILIALLNQSFHYYGENSYYFHDIMDQMTFLSFYLGCWGGDYPQDSLRVLALFYSIFRLGKIQSMTNTSTGKDVAKSVRDSLLCLYKPSTSQRINEDISYTQAPSSLEVQSEKTVFDTLPVMGQRLLTSIFDTLDE